MVLGGFGRGQQTHPGVDFKVIQPGNAALDERGHVGQRFGALRAGHRNRPQFAGLDMALRPRHSGVDQRNVAAQYVSQRLATALVRHVNPVGTGALLK